MSALGSSSGSAVSYRLAEAGDTAGLDRLGGPLLVPAGNVDWTESFGDGRDMRTPLSVVASRDDGTVGGMVVVKPLSVRPEQAFTPGPRRRAYSVDDVPWWKVKVLAVAPDLEGQGVARELLRQVVGRVPAAVTGLYGNVSFESSRALAWYRRQGFHIGPVVTLSGRRGAGLVVNTKPGEVTFRASTRRLADLLAGRPRPESDARLLRDDFRQAARVHSVPDRRDVGYRMYGRRVAETVGTDAGCAHLGVNDLPSVVMGWDPELRRVCTGCHLVRADNPAVAGNDASDRCDGCGRTDKDVLMGSAVLDDERLIVSAGLCPRCRSGALPAHLVR
jgi:ribosomal protein S18 acetylase RimI-like enzyme